MKGQVDNVKHCPSIN